MTCPYHPHTMVSLIVRTAYFVIIRTALFVRCLSVKYPNEAEPLTFNTLIIPERANSKLMSINSFLSLRLSDNAKLTLEKLAFVTTVLRSIVSWSHKNLFCVFVCVLLTWWRKTPCRKCF